LEIRSSFAEATDDVERGREGDFGDLKKDCFVNLKI
jgi:hypothetical protein